MLRTLFSALVLFACTAFGQPTYTQITDTIYTPVGGVLFNGTLQISNPVLVGTAGNTIGQWAYTTQIVNGAVSLRLVPTDTSSPPGTQYVFRFTPQLNNGSAYIEYCNVPTTNSTVTLSQICATGSGATVNLNQITQSLATTGQFVQWNGTHWVPVTFGGGTVTSVSFTGGLISVANPTSTPALTVAGTSGGIPYFSTANTWASSGALGANAVVIGGGAGSAPSTISGDTATTHALFATAGAPAFRAIVAGDIPTLNQNTTGNAATATALAGTPTLCSTGFAPTGILPSGNATGCASIGGGTGTVTNIATTGPITGGPITTTGTIACPTCTTSASSLTSGQLLFGAGGTAMAVGDLSGDATTSGSGAVMVVKINGTLLSGLATGILKNTTGTGIPSIAVAGTDYVTPTGNGSGLTNLTAANISAGTAGISISGNAATATALATLPGSTNQPLWNSAGSLAAASLLYMNNYAQAVGANSLTAGDLFDVTTPYTAATLPGTVSVSGTAVTGSGTSFLETYTAGDTITVVTTSGTETQTIASVPSDTAMTTSAFAGTASGVTYIGNDPVGGNLRWRVLQNGQLVAGNSGSAINLRQLLYAAPVYTNPASNVSVRVLNVAPVLNVTSAPFSGNYISANFNTEIGAANTQNLTGTGVGLAGARGEVTATAGSSGVVSLASGVIGHLLFPSGAATLTTGYLFQGSVTATGITNLAGIAIPDLTGATSSTAVLIGTTIIPTGQNWGIYDASSLTSFLHQLQLGNIAASSPVAATDASQNLIAGTVSGTGSTVLLQNSPTLTPSANTTALTYSGYSLTGSNAQPMITATGAWNTSSTVTIDYLNQTDTASGSESAFFDRLIGGVSKFRVRKDGLIENATYTFPKAGNIGSMIFAWINNSGGNIADMFFPNSNNAVVCTTGAATNYYWWPVTGYLRNLQAYTTTVASSRQSWRLWIQPDCYGQSPSTTNSNGNAIIPPNAASGVYADPSSLGTFEVQGGNGPGVLVNAQGSNGLSGATILDASAELIDSAGTIPTVMNQGNLNTLTASNTCFLSVWWSGSVGIPCFASPTTANYAEYSLPIPVAGTLSQMWISPYNVAPTNNVVYTMTVNGAAGNETKTLQSTDTLPEVLVDTAHSDAVAAGSYAVIKAVTGATTQADAGRWGYIFTPSGSTSSLVGWQIAATAPTSTTYYTPDSQQSSTTLANNEAPVPLAAGCKLANLAVTMSVLPNAGVTDTFTIIEDSGATVVTGTITSASSVGFNWLDQTHSITIGQGHLLSLSVVASAANGGTIGGVAATCN